MAISGVRDTVQVTGRYLNVDGTPIRGGVVTFTSKVAVTETASQTVVVPTTITANLDADGAFSVSLMATDAPRLRPNGWTYTVREEFAGGRTFEMAVPISAKRTGIDLSTGQPTAPSSTTTNPFGRVLARRGLLAAAGSIGAGIAAAPLLGGASAAASPPHATAAMTTSGPRAVAPPLADVVDSTPAAFAPAHPVGWRNASSVITTMQAGHGWTASGNLGGSNLNDTSNFVRGTQSASVTTIGTGKQANLDLLARPAINLTGKALRLVLRVDDYTRLFSLNCFVGTNGLSNNFKWRFNALTDSNKIGLAGDWIVVTLQWSELNSAAGTFTINSAGVPSATSGFTDIRVQATDLGTGPLTLWLQAVEIIDSSVSTWPNGIISITFDDSNDSVRLARPKMDTLGFRGTQYTIADAIGATSKLTMPELVSMQNFCGWEIAGHAYTGAAHSARYTSLTAAQVDDELRSLRAWLVTNGFNGDSFAYPGGDYAKTTDGVPVDSLAARYFGTARTILSDVGVFANCALDALPAAMPYRLRCLTGISGASRGISNPTTLAAAGGVLDKVSSNGGWLSLVFHNIISGTATDAATCSQADFNTLMDAIASRGIPVAPVSEIVRRAGQT